jgi:hypothetical protein
MIAEEACRRGRLTSFKGRYEPMGSQTFEEKRSIEESIFQGRRSIQSLNDCGRSTSTLSAYWPLL